MTTATETTAESGARVCVWCGRSIVTRRRKDARTCTRSACRVGFDRALARLQEPQDDEWPPPPDPLAGVRRRIPIAPLTDEEQMWFDIYVEREAICVEAGVALPVAQENARREADAAVAAFLEGEHRSHEGGSTAPFVADPPQPEPSEGEDGDGTENR